MAQQKKFFFAWVDEGDEFDAAVHNRTDENVFSFDYSQDEGDFAGLEIIIKNPRIGLLNVGRKLWAIFSFTHDGGTTITPIFRGRLVGIPNNIFDTLVTLQFTARPVDFVDQKHTLAESMKVLPFYDSIFISPDSWADDDTVLEGYSSLWHIDPVTLVVTASDILIGEDGTEEVTEAQHFRDGMEVTLSAPPARAVTMTATIPWVQSAAGAVQLGGEILIHMGATGGIIHSFTGPGLIDDWPKVGDDFGNGWEVGGSTIKDLSGIMPMVDIPPIFSWEGTVPLLPIDSVVFPLKVTGEYHAGEKAGFNFQFELVIAATTWMNATLNVKFARSIDYGQTVTFTLFASQQAIATMPGDDEAISIALSANPVSDFTADNTIPLYNLAASDYVHSQRGVLSVQYLMLVARATLLAKSRAVEIVAQLAFVESLRLLSLRKNMLLHDHRLPGGQAVGKIVKTHLSLDGDTGEAIGEITIASAIGYGDSVAASDGTPSYVGEGYFALHQVQAYTNRIVVLDTSDIAYSLDPYTVFDDGFDFVAGLGKRAGIRSFHVDNTPDIQKAGLLALIGTDDFGNQVIDQSAVQSYLQGHPTQFTVQMEPMDVGPFTQEVVVSVSDLVIPKQIDLEAASNA